MAPKQINCTLFVLSLALPSSLLSCKKKQSPHIMGEFTITSAMSAFVWLISIGIIAVNLFIVGGFLVDQGNSTEGASGWLYAGAGVGASLYLGFILFLLRDDLQRLKRRAASLFMMLGGYDFVSGGGGGGGISNATPYSRKHRVPSEDDGLCDFLESPDMAAVAVGNKPPLSGVGQDYAPVSAGSSILDREEEEGERDGGGFGAGGGGVGVGDGEIGQQGSGRSGHERRGDENGDVDDGRA